MTSLPADQQFTQLFTLIRVIGSGSFGTVMHVIDRQTGEECAVKAISKAEVTPQRLDDLRKEADILNALDHPNIVRFRHVRETVEQVYLVMEMVYGGTLAAYIAKKKLTDMEAASAMTGVFRAVQYLHSQGVIHRDLKPENILVENPLDLTSIKIADFGLSKQFNRDQINTSDAYCGTVLFMAPEQIERRYYSKGVDIWSCGVIMYMLCSGGQHPLKEPTDSLSTYYTKLKSPHWKLEPLTPLGRSLFTRLVRLQPVERYSASQALLHPWITRERSDVPLTPLEQFRMYNDELKTKKILWALLFIGKLTKITVEKPQEPEVNSAGLTVNREGSKPQLSTTRRSFSVRIRRTPVRIRPTSTTKCAKPPIPKKPMLRSNGTKAPQPSKPRVLRPLTSSRRVNVSYNEY